MRYFLLHMGICWYCHWGWPSQVVDIYNRYLAIAGESAMHYGPAHIVWEDENFGRKHVQWCLDNADEYRTKDCTDAEHEAVKQSLRELLVLPDRVLAAIPEDYDDEHPDRYPPAADLTMQHR